jgi:hypothetical protein
LADNNCGGLAVAYLSVLENELAFDRFPLWLILQSARLIIVNDITGKCTQYRTLGMCSANFVALYSRGDIANVFGWLIPALFWHEGQALLQENFVQQAVEPLEQAYDGYRQLRSAPNARMVTESLAIALSRIGDHGGALQAIDRLTHEFPGETSETLAFTRLRLLGDDPSLAKPCVGRSFAQISQAKMMAVSKAPRM